MLSAIFTQVEEREVDVVGQTLESDQDSESAVVPAPLNASADDVIARKPGNAPVLNDSVLRYHVFEPAHSTAGVHRELELPAGCRLFV